MDACFHLHSITSVNIAELRHASLLHKQKSVWLNTDTKAWILTDALLHHMYAITGIARLHKVKWLKGQFTHVLQSVAVFKLYSAWTFCPGFCSISDYVTDHIFLQRPSRLVFYFALLLYCLWLLLAQNVTQCKDLVTSCNRGTWSNTWAGTKRLELVLGFRAAGLPILPNN